MKQLRVALVVFMALVSTVFAKDFTLENEEQSQIFIRFDEDKWSQKEIIGVILGIDEVFGKFDLKPEEGLFIKTKNLVEVFEIMFEDYPDSKKEVIKLIEKKKHQVVMVFEYDTSIVGFVLIAYIGDDEWYFNAAER